MKTFLVFLSFAFALNSYALENDETQFQPHDMKGQWQVQISEFDRMVADAKENFAEINEGLGSILFPLLGMKLEISTDNLSFGLDSALMLETIGQPAAEESNKKQIIFFGEWSTDEDVLPTELGMVLTRANGNKQDDEKLACVVRYPSQSQFHLSCQEENLKGGTYLMVSKLENGEVQVITEKTDGGRNVEQVTLAPLMDWEV